MDAAAAMRSPVGHEDPLGSRFPLPLTATYYPLGFPFEIATNSAEVLTAAAALWGAYPRLSVAEPARLFVAVEGEGGVEAPFAVVHGREHLVSVVQSAANFATADLSRGIGYARLTHHVASNREQFRYQFLEPLVYLMVDALHLAPVHASCVAMESGAVILCGGSGAGKTSLAYACARSGWTYLSDDATHVLRHRDDYMLAGRPHVIRFRQAARNLFPELAAFAPAPRPNGKWDIEVAPERLGIRTAYRAEGRAIAFLDRRDQPCASGMSTFSRAAAREILEQVVCYGDERSQGEQRATLHTLLQLPVLQLTYHDVAEAQRELRRLLV